MDKFGYTIPYKSVFGWQGGILLNKSLEDKMYLKKATDIFYGLNTSISQLSLRANLFCAVFPTDDGYKAHLDCGTTGS